MALTIEEIDAVEKTIAFHEAGGDPKSEDSLRKLQEFHKLSDEALARYIVYYMRALTKHFEGTANYPRLVTEIKSYDRKF